MERETIAEIAHDVVAVSPEPDHYSCTAIGQDPDRDGRFGSKLRGVPDEEDGAQWADSVGNII